MTRVHGWLADGGGCGYYRVALPLSTLPPPWEPSADRKLPPLFWEQADVVVGQRIAKPNTSQLWLDVCRHPDVRAVYELDDDFWSLDPSNPCHDWYTRPDVLATIEANIAAADAVTTSTEPLAERVRAWNERVTVVPNYVDESMLMIPAPDQALDTVTIGWAGSPTHSIDWAVCQREVAGVVAGEPNVRMAFMGTRFPAGLPRDRVSWLPWVQDMGRYYEQVISRFDIALAPLAHHPFNTSKSAIRPLEVAALGIPIIASDERPYREFVRHGETGWLVHQPHEWGVYLRKLIADRDMRIEMGAAARRQAAGWTIQGHIGEWEKALRP